MKWLKRKEKVQKMEESKNRLSTDVSPNAQTYNTLLSMYCKLKNPEKISEIFEEMEKNNIRPDVISYNTLIDMYVSEKKTEEALETFEKMQKNGISPITSTYSSLMKLHHVTMEQIEVFNEKLMKNKLHDMNSVAVYMYQCGFRGKMNKLLSFWEMILREHEHVVLNFNCFSLLLEACGRRDELEMCKKVFGDLLLCLDRSRIFFRRRRDFEEEKRRFSVIFRDHVFPKLDSGDVKVFEELFRSCDLPWQVVLEDGDGGGMKREEKDGKTNKKEKSEKREVPEKVKLSPAKFPWKGKNKEK
eukprot:TRINITY_DN7140_c0_g1_i2.p1 TRINITY_DN7140_c0_g1~~TRINITY_DN7140_c0_g1_i2.p1  ORF type:complete len:301 (-),score=105.02 TRINITY_DN7140_c0_g1_i2:155-1057(-)